MNIIFIKMEKYHENKNLLFFKIKKHVYISALLDLNITIF